MPLDGFKMQTAGAMCVTHTMSLEQCALSGLSMLAGVLYTCTCRRVLRQDICTIGLLCERKRGSDRPCVVSAGIRVRPGSRAAECRDRLSSTPHWGVTRTSLREPSRTGRAWPLAETVPVGEPDGDTLQVLGDALHQGRSHSRGPVG